MKKLSKKTKLIWIKSIHTMVWMVFVTAIVYILYAGIFDNVNILVWICIGLIFLEAIVLLACRWKCPLTLLAQKYSDSSEAGFDIFLPVWLAKYNKMIFSIMFFIGLALVLWRIFG